MGYGTNATTIPVLSTPGTLIISDKLNHTSIVNGSRASSAVVRVFNHNDPKSLEKVLRDAIIHGTCGFQSKLIKSSQIYMLFIYLFSGQPRHHRPWSKIIVIVEGIYSMEGINLL